MVLKLLKLKDIRSSNIQKISIHEQLNNTISQSLRPKNRLKMVDGIVEKPD